MVKSKEELSDNKLFMQKTHKGSNKISLLLLENIRIYLFIYLYDCLHYENVEIDHKPPSILVCHNKVIITQYGIVVVVSSSAKWRS